MTIFGDVEDGSHVGVEVAVVRGAPGHRKVTVREPVLVPFLDSLAGTTD